MIHRPIDGFRISTYNMSGAFINVSHHCKNVIEHNVLLLKENDKRLLYVSGFYIMGSYLIKWSPETLIDGFPYSKAYIAGMSKLIF